MCSNRIAHTELLWFRNRASAFGWSTEGRRLLDSSVPQGHTFRCREMCPASIYRLVRIRHGTQRTLVSTCELPLPCSSKQAFPLWVPPSVRILPCEPDLVLPVKQKEHPHFLFWINQTSFALLRNSDDYTRCRPLRPSTNYAKAFPYCWWSLSWTGVKQRYLLYRNYRGWWPPRITSEW